MKLHFTFGLVFILLLSGVTSLSAQLRLDVAFEGPWLFYVAPDFKTGSTVLVAVAPKVPGHHDALFSAGDGISVAAGIYCVGFDDQCVPNGLSSLNHGSYADPLPVAVYKPAGWDWKMLSSAYVFILPMPDTHSADGQYPASFQSAFPKSGLPDPPTTESGVRAIGMQLHYTAGPQKLGLLRCSGVPSVATCNTPASTDQANSGTLRITIKSEENPATPDTCDYHVHRAYHKMLHLLDPTLSNPMNAQKAYLNVPTYNDKCSPCDPQQEIISSDCNTMVNMTASSEMRDVPSALDTLVAFLTQLNLNPGQREQVQLARLTSIAEALKGKFPSQSQLIQVKDSVRLSTQGIDQLLLQLASDTRSSLSKGSATSTQNLRVDLKAAAAQERALDQEADIVILSGTSGKDCRAAVMIIQ